MFVPVIIGQAGDPYLSSVKFLMHMEGANGGTSFPEFTGKTATFSGNVNTSTTSPLMGGASAYFDGNGDYLQFANSADFDFGTGDFTIEALFKITDVSAVRTLVYWGKATDTVVSDYGFYCQYNNSTGKISFTLWNGSTSYTVTSTTTISVNTKYQIGVKRASGSLTLWINGALEATTSANVAINNPTGALFYIGRSGANALRYMFGYVDEVRITKGVARDLSQIQTEPFPEYE